MARRPSSPLATPLPLMVLTLISLERAILKASLESPEQKCHRHQISYLQGLG